MTADEVLADSTCALGIAAAPPFLAALAVTDADFLSTAWPAGAGWLDSEFFEEAGVIAGAALEEAADQLPPPEDDHVRLGALGGADLPPLDRAVEGLMLAAPRAGLLALAWQRAIEEEGFGNPARASAKTLCPGPPGFLRDLPRPPRDGHERAGEAAERLGIPGMAGHFVPLTPWPAYLRVATTDLARQIGEMAWAEAVDRIARSAHEIVSSLAPPMPALHGAAGAGATIVGEAAGAYPALVMAAAYLRLGLPAVARIPRVA